MSYFGRGLGDAATVNVDDFGSVVAALSLPWTPDMFGFTSWDSAVQTIRSTNGLFKTLLGTERPDLAPDAYIGSPGLVALVDVWTRFHQLAGGYLPTAEQVETALGVWLVSGIVGTGNAIYSPRPASVPVSAFDWNAYASEVLGFAPLLEAMFRAAEPSLVAPVLQQTTAPTATQQWNAALMNGALAIPLDANVDPVAIPPGAIQSDFDANIPVGFLVVPQAAIVEGPTLLPDGTWYVVHHSDPTNGADPAVLTVHQWGGPKFVGAKAQNVSIRPDSCVPLVPGTGAWYWNTALTGSDPTNPCTGVPVGWSQGFSLVGPLAHQAVQQSYADAGLSLTPIGPVVMPNAPATPAVVVQPMSANLQPDPRVDASATDPATLVSSPSDASGLTQPTQPSYLPAIYSPLPSVTQSAAGPSTGTVVLAALAAVAGTLMILAAGKRAR